MKKWWILFPRYSSYLSEKAEPVKDEYVRHQDNSPYHKAEIVQGTLGNLHIETLPHPLLPVPHPYNPNLATCVFWLFPTLTDAWYGKRCEDKIMTQPRNNQVYEHHAHDGLAHVFC